MFRHSIITHAAARGADQVMHAAQYLSRVSKNNYNDPTVWKSTDPAVVLLRGRYKFLTKLLEYVNGVEDQNVAL